MVSRTHVISLPLCRFRTLTMRSSRSRDFSFTQFSRCASESKVIPTCDRPCPPSSGLSFALKLLLAKLFTDCTALVNRPRFNVSESRLGWRADILKAPTPSSQDCACIQRGNVQAAPAQSRFSGIRNWLLSSASLLLAASFAASKRAFDKGADVVCALK